MNQLNMPGKCLQCIRALLDRFFCLFLPLASLSFYISTPHGFWNALLWTLPVWLCVIADVYSPTDRENHSKDQTAWPFEMVLYLQVCLQLINIFLMLNCVSRLEWEGFDAVLVSIANLFAIRILTGTTSCCSGLAVAHELIHRRSHLKHYLGRLMLITVCYDHFSIEHIYGHHRKAGLIEDYATARYGETYADFWKRTVKGQYLNAWRLENLRLKGCSLFYRLMHHKVLHGQIVQIALLMVILLSFGIVATWMFLYQAFYALRLLESVNYFQHWGLIRSGGGFSKSDAWRTDSWVSLHAFVGLPRHADHHMFDDKPYQELIYIDEGPRLPYGYFAMYILVKFFNPRYQALAKKTLGKL